MANIMVTNPEAFSAEYEEFETAIREEMEAEESEIIGIMRLFKLDRNTAELVIMENRKVQPTTEELLAFFGR